MLFLLKSYYFLIFPIQIAADFIEDKTAFDDQQHNGKVQREVIVNITLVKPQANMCRRVNLLFRPVDYLIVSNNLNKWKMFTS